MPMINAKSATAQEALAMVTALQKRFVDGLEQASADLGHGQIFEPVTWLRDEGAHGGGTRLCCGEGGSFNRASVNVSQVHYDDDDAKKLASATAISTIIHPQNPHAPSIHIHISWTEMKGGQGYWRVMADLNPSLPSAYGKQDFDACLKRAAGAHFEEGKQQGERYFFIPALGRHRGVSHFYLEQFSTEDAASDFSYAQQFGEAVIDQYVEIFRSAIEQAPILTDEESHHQLAYHTLYLFQVLTLDRGTTSGLMVHDQNDVGIMGSIPARIDRSLLASWSALCEAPQDALVDSLAGVFSHEGVNEVTNEVKARLANVVRSHYRSHPEALQMQARGNVIPPTVDNHR